MAANIPEKLQEKLAARLGFYQDLGINLYYRRRGAGVLESPVAAVPVAEAESTPFETPPEDSTLAKSARKSESKSVSVRPQPISTNSLPLTVPKGTSLFESVEKIPDDSLLRSRADLGDCTRCKLHRTRKNIVFGDGNPEAKLVFVGEGPGADEDEQGLPFVGRAGKLLTQMIEAMGLERKQVYICNVVKCRPPENRQPEEDEVRACSPFLLRQLDTISPKVIVCLGAVAAKTILETNRGISQFRGQWLEFRGRKLMATYHPAYLLRNPSAKGEVWKDLQKVMAELGLPVKKGKSV
jgi:uracil-DNA glycosylase family 4